MKKLFKATVAVVSGVALLSGCTGQVYNQPKNCTYDYLFHPSVSISKIIGGCGPIDKLPQQQ
ncbi:MULTISPECIES: YhfL family protein [unclassified Pseudomonas]|uniref:YhfL family protein n=1 Tax=unclassified Pseudomonas TaxID=196821 RepID=UPI00118452E2|nr:MULTISPECIES: YhfL family protein [unclassified Pseudomonas]